ncbi:MAG: hypothetical protein ACI35W_07565 [Anaeroplasmataceae bacterium]
MFKWISNLKAKYLWLLFLGFTLLSALMVYVFTFINNKTITLILLIILFLITGTLFELAITKSLTRKPKENYNEIIHEFVSYEEMVNSLRENKFNSHKLSYGETFIKIIDETAYKVIFIKDLEKYLEPTEKDKLGSNTKGLDDCKRFVGFEIFYDYDDDMKIKMRNFSFCGDKVLYEGFYVTENEIVEPNYIEPSLEFKDDYEKLKEILGIK